MAKATRIETWKALETEADALPTGDLHLALYHILGNADDNACDTHLEGGCGNRYTESWATIALGSISADDASPEAQAWLTSRGAW